MDNLLTFFSFSYRKYWGDDIYQVWFYVAVVLILLLERRKMSKRIWGFYSLLFLVSLFNPISYSLVKKVTSGSWQYFTRLFSMLPLPFVLGVGTLLLMDWICGKLTKTKSLHEEPESNEESEAQVHNLWIPVLKLAMTTGICALIIFGGTDVYQEPWMQPAQNIEKVPSETISICQMLHKEEGVTIAVPSSLSSYIRQIDATFFTPYGRYVNGLGKELSKEHPNPLIAMRTAGLHACDYIVILNNPVNILAFREKGWDPYSVHGNYLIYKVEHVARVLNHYNDRHQLIYKTFLDAEDNPDLEKYGYAGIRYEYDESGNTNKVTYVNDIGEPMIIPAGYASVRYTYTRYSQQVASEMYLDMENNPVCANGRYETRFEYDSNRSCIQVSYYDVDGTLKDNQMQHYAFLETTYDDQGRIVWDRYYDQNGHPTRNSFGYSSCERVRNGKGELIQIKYYDGDGLLLGEAGTTQKLEANVFEYPYGTIGVYTDDSGQIMYTTSRFDNRFNAIHFQLWDVKNDQYLVSFGESKSVSETKGVYHPNLEGLYYLRLKGNTNLADEYIQSLVYLKENDSIAYSYTVDEIDSDHIVVSNAEAYIVPGE